MDMVGTVTASDDEVRALTRRFREAVGEFQFRQAETVWQELADCDGADLESDELLPPRVMLGVFQGRLMEMIQMLNGMDDDRAPGLKAICLQIAGDPLWEGLAEHLEATTDDPVIRRSMQSLLKARTTGS